MAKKAKAIVTECDLEVVLKTLQKKWDEGLYAMAVQLNAAGAVGVRRSGRRNPLATYIRQQAHVKDVTVEGNTAHVTTDDDDSIIVGLTVQLETFLKAFHYGAFPTLAVRADEYAEATGLTVRQGPWDGD